MQKSAYLFVLLISCLADVFAQAAPSPSVKAVLSTDSPAIRADEIVELDVTLTIPEGMHIYSSEAPAVGLPTRIDFDLPAGFSIISEHWDRPKKFFENDTDFEGYKNSATITFALKTPDKLTKAGYLIKCRAFWLECTQTSCVPAKTQLEIELKNPAAAAVEEETSAYALLLMAFAGGLILNLMPCVFPVIGLKILSFAKAARESRGGTMLQALAYSFGILLSFWALALLLCLLRSAGGGIGWGFQMQEPLFVAALAILFTALSLNFAGFFEVGLSLSGKAGNLAFKSETAAQKSPLISALLSGALAVAVASPCTAPFMGTAVGAALLNADSPALIFAIFTALGIGMALPYVLLSINPKWARMLPKSGRWMLVLKQFLSLPLFATVAWLVWVFALQTSCADAALLTLSLVALGASFWLFGRWAHDVRNARARRAAVAGSAILFGVFLALGAYIVFGSKGARTDEGPDAWSLDRQEEMLEEGRPLYVDFTAAWCLTCQANKPSLYSEKVREYFEKNGIELLVADWTSRNDETARELAKFGRAGVPLNVFYPKGGGKPVVLPALLTPEIIIDSIDKAAP